MHAQLSSIARCANRSQLLSCQQEDDAEIEELLAAAEAMPLTQPEDAATAAAANPAPITASQVVPGCYQCCRPDTCKRRDLGCLPKPATALYHHCSSVLHHQHIMFHTLVRKWVSDTRYFLM